MKKKIVALSGGFDPIHVGHVRMIKHAADLGRVVVFVNSDAWLLRKKGYVFMPFVERLEIVRNIDGVEMAIEAVDDDESVCESLRMLRPDIFANGGDRKSDNVPEVKLCNELGIELVWNVGGDKIQSSSELVKNNKGTNDSE